MTSSVRSQFGPFRSAEYTSETSCSARSRFEAPSISRGLYGGCPSFSGPYFELLRKWGSMNE